MKRLSALAALTLASAAQAQGPVTPLFAADSVIPMTIRGQIGSVVSSKDRSRVVAATLTTGTESLPVRLSPRGITRLSKETCQFPPLRVEFTGTPPASSLFSGQKRLKLVTHCRTGEAFQQHVLLEYAIYRLYGQLTPQSFRARLAQIDYVEDSGRPVASRFGFFIEDLGDVARRNGQKEARVGHRVSVTTLAPVDAARFGVFQYLIGNLDWAMQAGPEGDGCCHNSRLISGTGNPPYTTVPYDFDFSGLVDAPYATPPELVKVSSVRVRRYRGFCRHNSEALAAARQVHAAKAQLLATLAATPGLSSATLRKAGTYLERGFADLASDQLVTDKLLKTCVG